MRVNEKPQRTKPDEGEDEGNDEAEAESQSRKPNEKAEGESRRRSRRPDKKKKKKKRKKKTRDAHCLPATGKSGQTEKRMKKPKTRRRIPRKRRRNPATTGTLIRHTNQILPRLGSAPRCSASRCAEYSASERSPSSKHACNAQDTREAASIDTPQGFVVKADSSVL